MCSVYRLWIKLTFFPESERWDFPTTPELLGSVERFGHRLNVYQTNRRTDRQTGTARHTDGRTDRQTKMVYSIRMNHDQLCQKAMFILQKKDIQFFITAKGKMYII